MNDFGSVLRRVCAPALCALALVCASPALAATADGHAQSATDGVKDTLVSLEQQSWVAWKGRDGAFFASFLAEDHVEMGAGGPAGKKSVVAFVGSPACVVTAYALDDFRYTRISDDVALLVYHARQKTLCGGAPVPSPVWASSLYVRREGRWVNAVYQQTPAG